MKAITDTGFLVAFGNRRDLHHIWAREIAQRVTEPLLTCEAVLAETAFHLGSASLVLAFVEGLVRRHSLRPTIFHGSRNWRHDTPIERPDLADLCLIRLTNCIPGIL
jgi:predicted nucleic acid-binding protein